MARWNLTARCNDCEFYAARVKTIQLPSGQTYFGDGTCTLDGRYTQAKFTACPVFEWRDEWKREDILGKSGKQQSG